MTPTAEHLARYEQHITTMLTSYNRLGMSPQQCQELEDALRSVEGDEWMDLEQAQMTLVSVQMSPDSVDKHTLFLANRTSVAASRSERLAVVAKVMGVSYAHAGGLMDSAGGTADRADDGADACWLYRHLDPADALLYVGIAKNPHVRRDQHRAHSEWFRFAVEMTTEVHNSRASAERAERAAIKAELPIFNKTHADQGRSDRATQYLAENRAWDLLRPAI